MTDLSWVDSLSVSELKALHIDTLRLVKETSLLDYKPYAKQRDFHAAGVAYRERLLMAANQVGKTWAGGAEYAMHLTGRYPGQWWRGREWRRPIVGWAAGVTGELTRDGPQRILMGRANAIGTGTIPLDAIKDYSMKRGVADAIDTVVVRHGGGGDVQADESILTFKSYDQGAAKFASETLDLLWFDEEPELAIYTEGLTRTNTTGGMVYMTFTPLLGMSDVVARFLLEASPDRTVISMTIDDAEHYTPEQRQKIIASYPAHERDARARGIPIMGSGRVYPVEEEAIKFRLFPFPEHFVRIAAMDFGWTHPTAVVWLAWDRDSDIVYVYDAYRLSEQPVAVHASAIKARGAWIPVAWPHDGENETAQGPQLAKQYREEGVNMRPERAQYPETSDRKETDTRQSRVSVEAGVADILDRMVTGRLKVAEHLNDVFEEFRLYHRKNGKIVKERDDLMSAIRYGIMDLRFAIVQPRPTRVNVHRPLNWRAP